MLYQLKYKFLETVVSDMPEIKYSKHDTVIDHDEDETNFVIIFDDVVCIQQNKIRCFFSVYRHTRIIFSVYAKHVLE